MSKIRPLYNDTILVNAEKKPRRGDGAAAILSLMASMLDFLEKIDVCIEAQIKPEHKNKIEGYKEQIETVYMDLAEMSKEAIQEVTLDPQGNGTAVVEQEAPGDTSVDDIPIAEVSVASPTPTMPMISAPTIPRI